MSEGQRFLDKCLEATVAVDPWPYQILNDTLSTLRESLKNLVHGARIAKKSCKKTVKT